MKKTPVIRNIIKSIPVYLVQDDSYGLNGVLVINNI